ncbi:MAG TPA: 50S ribosomal protein L21, partial [Bacteroidia bacterium]|nr:50S ribosomal protein L21 [Bacteroidia bacterium]
MYAIVNIAGQQFKVIKDQQVIVHRLEGEEGKKLEFSDVVLVENGGKVKVGTPSVKGASVTASIVTHLRGDKVI